MLNDLGRVLLVYIGSLKTPLQMQATIFRGKFTGCPQEF